MPDASLQGVDVGGWSATRRCSWHCVAVLGLVLIGGCSTTGNIALDTARLLVTGGPDLTPDAGEVANSPYARIQIQGGGLRSVMVLGNDDDGRQSWYGDRRHIVFLRDGLVVGTLGLSSDVDTIYVEGDNPFRQLAQVGEQPVTVRRRYDWRDGYRYGVPVIGQLSRRDTEEVEILGARLRLVRYEEDLRGPGVRARNEYWVEPDTGQIRKSRQYVAQGTMLEIVVLKSYRQARR